VAEIYSRLTIHIVKYKTLLNIYMHTLLITISTWRNDHKDRLINNVWRNAASCENLTEQNIWYMLLSMRWKGLNPSVYIFSPSTNFVLNDKIYLADIYNLQSFLTLCFYWFVPATWYRICVVKVVSKFHSISRGSLQGGTCFDLPRDC